MRFGGTELISHVSVKLQAKSATCSTQPRQDKLPSNKSAQDRQCCCPSVDKAAKDSKHATRGITLSTWHARCTPSTPAREKKPLAAASAARDYRPRGRNKASDKNFYKTVLRARHNVRLVCQFHWNDKMARAPSLEPCLSCRCCYCELRQIVPSLTTGCGACQHKPGHDG